MPSYNLTIENNSGSFQEYALVNQVPDINGAVQGQTFAVILATASVGPGDNAEFQIDGQPVVVTGQGRGRLQDGVTVNVGYQQHGTSFDFSVNQGRGQLSGSGSSSSGGIEIRSGSFDGRAVAQDSIFVGIGFNVFGDNSPAAVFTPQPNTTYQIRPSTKFFVASGNFRKGSVINQEALQYNAGQADFSQRPSASISHSPNGRFEQRH